eukprot:GHUV01039685.1.p1 GENE.GHUV01039685.1~~GHUV01039685.1.p1  ORF type:complete len:127 (-),score=11.32 GHUV01039685.1:6-386(-)
MGICHVARVVVLLLCALADLPLGLVTVYHALQSARSNIYCGVNCVALRCTFDGISLPSVGRLGWVVRLCQLLVTIAATIQPLIHELVNLLLVLSAMPCHANYDGQVSCMNSVLAVWLPTHTCNWHR